MYGQRRPPKRLPEGVELREREDSGERTFTRRKKTTALKSYDVVQNGEVIGRVYQGEATFETRSKGKMYVNRRWTNIRWYYERDGFRYYRSHYETRVGAVEALLWVIQREAEQAAEEAAEGAA